MSLVASVLNAIANAFGFGHSPVLVEISRATGVPASVLARSTTMEILEMIRAAGIPYADIPPHVADALGLVRAGDR
ncbi:hypothetical protein [Pontivivens ytuae]|uniref:Uncharacterized protein n=1 Tax=Pontivivens ytuae TaxID=2789856 RepID=A0A7S9LU36_9RHOB|nr:hypothetical protein [Pontivivens ytuae]QPH55257.1 hypothetical protein I0K15_05815 [Pontivivens ytuae]